LAFLHINDRLRLFCNNRYNTIDPRHNAQRRVRSPHFETRVIGSRIECSHQTRLRIFSSSSPQNKSQHEEPRDRSAMVPLRPSSTELIILINMNTFIQYIASVWRGHTGRRDPSSHHDLPEPKVKQVVAHIGIGLVSTSECLNEEQKRVVLPNPCLESSFSPTACSRHDVPVTPCWISFPNLRELSSYVGC
jgi:hypothetical protein